MYNRSIIPTLILTILLLLSACGGKKKASLQSQAVLPDKTLYENGLAYINKGHYLKARLALQTLINTYEESEYLEGTKFYIAYSYMREGGVENLIQAEQGFKDFRLFFPTSELADDAQAHVVGINMSLMRTPNRDQTHTQKAHMEIRAFIRDFPNSTLMDEMRLRLQYVEETLAMSEFHKGNFYYKKKLYKASTGRFRDCVQNFTRFGKRDEVLFMLADSLDHQRNYDESSLYYSQIVRGYPFSEYFENSRERLQQLERPIPEVDEALAAENLQAYTLSKSIWKSSFSGLFGLFGGGEKPWKEFEKERREAEKEKLKTYEVTKN